MKLWVAFESEEYEGACLLGVFTSRDLAREACNIEAGPSPDPHSARSYRIEPVTVDERTEIWPR
jgi:hypothetical protein